MEPSDKQRVSSVSFTPEKGDGSSDEIHISLAPYIQTYLAHSAQGMRCFGIGLPIPFERAASRSWWNPKFDSEILEEQYKQSVFPQLRSRFRYALAYILLFSLSWLIYVVIIGAKNKTVSAMIVTTFCTIIIVMALALYLTYTKYYKRYMVSTSLIVGSLLCLLSLLFLVLIPPCNGGLSLVGHFSLCSEILLLIYTVIPLPLYVAVALCTMYSVLFEIVNAYIYLPITEKTKEFEEIDFGTTLIIRILMQTCIHIIALHILIMTFVRMRGTFMKVGQSLLVRRQLEMEKQLKEKMIHSVMPPKVADWLMTESEREREREDSIKKGSIPSNNTDIHSMFRPFNMHSMENVSILFADIVGFTRMSSNKTAEQLVDILNDLFERFDELCEQHGCEKISTLGDCYYCVSGCPEPRLDHARCCVEMGLAMIEAIKQFDIERREGVNMRVGVHTGTVLCGIVGTKRFKFDVWSNDVNLANKLESTGMPGRVHLSEATLSFLGDEYVTEESTIIQGMKTYFIKDKKANLINEFTTGLNISPLLTRHRLASCNNQSKPRQHYLHMLTTVSSCRIKANSLPSILDSEDDQHSDYETEKKEDFTKSPTSMSSRSKSRRGKAWKYLQRQRTTEEMTPLETKSSNSEKIVRANSAMENHNQFNGLNRILPVERIEMDPDPSPAHSIILNDKALSHASSICSRKDSGIKSNSRRSSIQQQLFLMNGMCQNDLLGHRVSGYYTSTSTLNSAQDPPSSTLPSTVSPVITDTFGACFHKLRKQSDLQLIKCVQDNVSSQRSQFAKPPLSSLTLFFQNKEMEKEYRENAHKASENIGENPPTLATARFNTYFDILVSAIVYSAVTTSLFLICPASIFFVIFVVIATAIQVIVIMLCFRHLIVPQTIYTTITQKIFKFLTRWYPWHACGAILVSLPAVSILINISGNTYRSTLNHFEYYYSYLIFVGLVHFCNFTQLNCWMKNFFVTIAAIFVIFLVTSTVFSHDNAAISGNIAENSMNLMFNKSNFINYTQSNFSLIDTTIDSSLNMQRDFEISMPNAVIKEKNRRKNCTSHLYDTEIFLDMFLLLLLVWFLNREFEIRYRLSFYGNAVAARDKSRVQAMKNQADWLLHNIIPKYVADQLKTTAKYSQNHKSVGIIFASIVNFNELYDESYLGGKEYLRVLNELIGDFDELLEKPQFSHVEKIKTIGSTFMAASGLNPQVREQSYHEYWHLFQLLDFAVAMQKVIDDFNRDLLGFKLILRVGFNYGDVTAGVIGATKLYYDIWGDAVNIASRMDSTGVPGRIQLASNSLAVLSEKYDFEPRGQVYVKGKDHMDVFLMIGKKENLSIV